MHKALVIDVILDPLNLTDEQKQDIADTTQTNKDGISFSHMMPINTVIGRIVSNEGGQVAQTNMIILPWFSSHVMLPVKPGEIVNVIYDDYEGTGTVMPFWISRRHSPGTIEDVNFTHHDRLYDPTNNPSLFSLSAQEKTNSTVGGPTFPNGGGTDRTKTIEDDDNADEDVYERIKRNSAAYGLHETEPVPRFIKKPGDHVLQGSNNTLICLGQDRSGTINEEQDIKKFSGTIDMVAGRGRILPRPDSEEPLLTAPRVVTNSRGELETDKAPHRRGFKTNKNNPNEGNPDFINDAARLYVSMQTRADENFGLTLNKAGLDSGTSKSLPDLSGEGTFNRSHAVAKADHIRFVARNDEENGVAGTILLVREGQPNVDLGYIYIDEAGEIQIESEKIYLGEATGEKEPAILYTNYAQTINNLQQQIDHIQTVIASAWGAAVDSMGGPIVSLQSNAQLPKTGNLSRKQTVERNTNPKQHSLKTFNEPNPNR